MKNKNLRKEKGITLVALVITIVVLLILATVAITMLTGENNIITKAQQAKENYSKASINEEIKIADYENKIDQYIPKTLSPTILLVLIIAITMEQKLWRRILL